MQVRLTFFTHRLMCAMPISHEQVQKAQPLAAAFFNRHPLEVAPDLIGKTVVFWSPEDVLLAGRIVETEAYRWDEAGCHAWKNVHPDGKLRDPSLISAALFDRPGTSYVYISYGLHWMLNVVCEPEGIGGGVLIRAIEPVLGVAAMQKNRVGVKNPKDLTNGPGKLCQALGINVSHHRKSLQEKPLILAESLDEVAPHIGHSTRIGLAKGMGDDLPWRFFETQSRFVSNGKVSHF